jgi:branched-chain amino acid transport system substrate-binding protein
LGGEVAQTSTINKGDTNLEPVLTAIARSEAELLFFTIFHPEASYLVLQADDVEGMANVALMGAEILLRPDFVEAVGVSGVDLHVIGPARPEGAEYDSLVERYEATYGELPIGTYHAQTYDATNMLLDAIEAVAVQDSDGALHIGRQAIRDALYATRSFDGLTGSLTCDEFGDCGPARFNVLRLVDPEAGLPGLLTSVIYSYTGGE